MRISNYLLPYLHYLVIVKHIAVSRAATKLIPSDDTSLFVVLVKVRFHSAPYIPRKFLQFSKCCHEQFQIPTWCIVSASGKAVVLLVRVARLLYC